MVKKFENLQAPSALRDLKGWLVWRWVQRPGRPKALKMPYYLSGSVRNKTHGSAEDRSLLVTFEEAKAFASKHDFAGVGLALMPEFGITALDFDNCVKDGVIDPRVEQLTTGTYAELSPSGTGVRAFMAGESPDSKDSTPVDGSFGFETFHAKGFVTFTGNVTEMTELTGDENTVAPLTEAVKAFCTTRFKRLDRARAECIGAGKSAMGFSFEEIAEFLKKLPEDLHYDDWVSVGMCVHHETEGEGFDIWDEWSSRSPKYTSTEYSMERWVSFGRNGTAEYKTMGTVLQMIRDAGGETGVDVASPDEFQVLTPIPLKAHGEFGFYSMAELRERLGPPEWLIKGILPKTELGMLFGASTAGKSFVLMDMCAAIARGIDWNGRRVKKGRVLYVVAEGRGGFPNRMEAYCKKHGIDESEVPIVYAAGKIPNLADDVSVKAFIKEIKRFGPFDLIIIDTLAKVSVGADENSGKDMGIIMANAEAIGLAAGGTPILVHHSGKDTSRGSRGHGSLKGNVGVELEVSRAENAVLRTLYVHKVKDAPAGFGLDFKLEVVPVDQVDEDGVPETSCTVEYITGVARDAAVVTRQPRGAHERTVLNVAHEMTGLDPTAQVVAGDLVERAIAETVRGTSKQDNRRRDIKRALEALIEQGWLIEDGDYVQLGDEANAQ